MKKITFLFCIVSIACSCSKKEPSKTAKDSASLFQQASALRESGKKDSAYLYFNKAKDLYLQEKDSLGAGVAIVNMAMISTDLGDLFGGQELSLEAISYFDENNPVHGPYLLSNYNNLGIASSNLQQYSKAVEFYQKSLNFISDSAYYRVVQNNIANAYRKLGDYDKAAGIYRSALAKEKEPINYARLLSNEAYTKWLRDPGYKAANDLRRALNMRLEEKDVWGQNASYAQLADYYLKTQPDSARILSKQMYDAAIAVGSADNQVEALQKLIPLSNPEDSKRYFERYTQLKDSLQTARNNAKNQFVLIRYETEKHKADNLQLTQENTVKAIWIISLAAAILLGSILGALWYRRRRRRLELEAKNAIRESQLKTSKKVHDVVANGLYRLMSEMENTDRFDQEKILDGMEVLYEQSRDISHETSDEIEADFPAAIKHILRSFATARIKVAIVGNNKESWEGVPHDVKHELKHVLQELMVNMKKHSQASAAALRFIREGSKLNIWYSDNGAGIPAGTVFGNGLTNTGNRIKSIGGSVNFDAGTGAGLTIHIQIPVAR